MYYTILEKTHAWKKIEKNIEKNDEKFDIYSNTNF